MSRPIESSEVCPYCGEVFYLPSDCADHVKAEHFDFGSHFQIPLDDRSPSDAVFESHFHHAR